MRVFCLDANAILDFCYRFYPQEIFGSLWELLDSAVLARQIRFVMTKHIHDEVVAKITHMGYDKAVFDVFLASFDVQIIDDYDANLSQLKATLMSVTTAIDPKKLSNLDNDLSNICVSMMYRHTVITSEQGFNNNIATATNIRHLKIPDICRHFNVSCGNWLMVFREIGFNS